MSDSKDTLPADLRYAQTHEWVRTDREAATIGITDHAQEQLGDVVFVDLPEVGDRFDQGEEVGEIESVKAVSSIYAPLSGEVVEVNEALEDEPERVNDEPYDGGWLYKVKPSHPDEMDGLLDAEGYNGVLAEAD